jgi:hypothetical protein
MKRHFLLSYILTDGWNRTNDLLTLDQVLSPCSRPRHSPKLEREIGFEPMLDGFADRRLRPLGYTREYSGRDGGTRTRYDQLEGLIARHFAFVPKIDWYAWKDSNFHRLVSKTSASPFGLHARDMRMPGLEPGTSCFVDRRSSIPLSYIREKIQGGRI